MKKNYVVIKEENFDGSPSEVILGVFTSKRLAQAFIDSFHYVDWIQLRIEVHFLNPFESELRQGYKCFLVRMTREGQVNEAGISDPPLVPLCDEFLHVPPVGFDAYGNLYCNCYAEDLDHSIEICNKERLNLIAQNKWPQSKKYEEALFS